MSSLNLSRNLKGKDAISELLNSTSNNERISQLDIDSLRPYRKHPFKLYTDERLDNMIQSIKQYGILSPIIVRPIDETTYEILSGHNRTNAARIAGLKLVPAKVKDVDDDIADIIVVESNFIQRNEFLPSERAKAFQLQLEALNRQGKKNNLCSNGTEVECSRDIVAKNNNMSSIQIQRYIRLNFLTEGLLQMVDDKKLSFRPAVEISYLRKEEQEELEDILLTGVKISLKQAIELKEQSKIQKLSYEIILSMLTEKEINKIDKIQIPFDKIKSYIPDGMTEDEIVKLIIDSIKNE